MQVSGQTSNKLKTPQTQFNSNYAYVPVATQTQYVAPANQPDVQNCTRSNTVQTQPVQYPVSQVNQPQQTTVAPQQYTTQPAQYPQGYNPVQNTVYPQYQPTPQQQPQAQNQNIQVPSSASGVTIQIFNPSVQTPGSQAPTYNVNAPCYPSGYYTGQMGQDGKIHTTGGNIDNNGGTIDGNVNTGTNTGTIGNNNNNTTTTNNTTNVNGNENNENKKKTEKRKIVQLTDDYIRNLESYLNSQDKGVRLSAAKEVYARLEEDDSRHDDKALTALINKMLQDPSEEIRILALSALDSRICKGDDYTVGVLQNLQKNTGGYGQDAVDATQVLLKMSGKQVEKEFEVKDKPKKDKDETQKSSVKSTAKA